MKKTLRIWRALTGALVTLAAPAEWLRRWCEWKMREELR